MIIDKTIKFSTYTGALTGTTGGIHAAYNFAPNKSFNFTYNSMNLIVEVLKDTYWYGFLGLFNAFIWPISIPCWIISTIKYVKTPHGAD